MATMIRVRRSVAIGAFAAVAVAAPFAVALTTTADQATQAGPACLAWFGNKADGKCLAYSNGTGATVGTPGVAFGADGIGISTGPLLPGTTIDTAIGN
ncbi:DUF7155 family protein [Mycolicibacterium doricum]|uniref:Uncharacterized protein n=1 Tax=Mycolicibacterium doricum TaxID=126673 RepID=A0A1X1TDC8_9MYCO|nr:hypothetical protein [Mycolicibacterium doricum]MCV7266897.1 hypothetical protein [Mycolicibacterium doricum]ORV42509.1 hypothetical protein AWC01_08435 [Mycolicibacterium doricum]